MTLDSLSLQQNILQFKKNDLVTPTKLLDNYEVFCGIETKISNEISPKELKNALQKKNLTLLDVRKTIERDTFHMGGIHIPLHQLEDQLESLKDIESIIVYCQVGQRSSIATKILLEKFPDKNIKNLTGGIAAWSKL